jgi:hypothetical protein
MASVFIKNRSNRFTVGGVTYIAPMPDFNDNERTDDIDGGEDE